MRSSVAISCLREAAIFCMAIGAAAVCVKLSAQERGISSPPRGAAAPDIEPLALPPPPLDVPAQPTVASQRRQDPPASFVIKGAKPETSGDELRNLMSKRFNAGVAELEARTRQHRIGGVDSEVLDQAAHRLLQWGIELHESPAERAAFLNQYIDWTQALEKLARQGYEQGTRTSIDVHRAEYLHLDAQIRLLRLRPQNATETSPLQVTPPVGQGAIEGTSQRRESAKKGAPLLLFSTPLPTERPDDSQLLKLLKARYREALAETQERYQHFLQGQGELDRLAHAAAKLAKAGSELHEDSDRRAIFLGRYVELMRTIESHAQQHHQAGAGTTAELYCARALRLDGQIRLLRCMREADAAAPQ